MKALTWLSDHPVSGDEVLIPNRPMFYAPVSIMAGQSRYFLRHRRKTASGSTRRWWKSSYAKTKALILCNPNNPTGATLDRGHLLEIAEVVRAHDLIFISDEIYGRLTYVGEHTCAPSLPGMRDRTILLNGFSKSYAMTGWRVGYAAGAQDFISAMTKIHQYTMLCAPVTAQAAALEALRNGASGMKKMVDQYNRRRRLVIKAFHEMGLPCSEPRGAFYAFPDIRSTGLSSEDFAQQLLQEEKVAAVWQRFRRTGRGFRPLLLFGLDQ